MYDKLVAKVGNVDTRGFVWKTKYDTDKSELENNLVMQIKKLNRNENKIPIISVFATSSALTSAENKTPDFNNLVRKINYNAKISDIGNK